MSEKKCKNCNTMVEMSDGVKTFEHGRSVSTKKCPSCKKEIKQYEKANGTIPQSSRYMNYHW